MPTRTSSCSPSPQALRAAYDLIVFPGHTEYVTSRLYDLITVYRDLGGRLIFLSANNFFRHVKRTGNVARLIGEWRNEGRPESALLGGQYLANDSGQRQQPFTVGNADGVGWLFAGTGSERLAVRQVRDRDRRDDPGLAAGDAGARARSPICSGRAAPPR